MSKAYSHWVTPENVSLFTDLYQLTMADSYLSQGLNQEATYNLFVRKLPRNRHFLICAGIESALDYLENLRFTADGIAYLHSLDMFSTSFLEYLESFEFTGDVYAILEGEIVFPPEPLVEIRAPRIEAQIIETFLLNQINFQTSIASKAARVVLAAGDRSVVDFSPRRDHGLDAAHKAARAAYLAGCAGTSNVLAGQLFGIPVYGTMAHAYVMAFEHEADAFRAFAQDFPNNSTLLVDTYDTLNGVRIAIDVAKELKEKDQEIQAIRLDSGDFLLLSRQARELLDQNGFPEIKIFASGDLNENKIAELLTNGAPINAFGVGTELGTSFDAPALGGVYKLVEDQNGPQMKLSAGKATLPGQKQVWRSFDSNGKFSYDIIGLANEDPPEPSAMPLLNQVMKSGNRIQASTSLDQIREYCVNRYNQLPQYCQEITLHDHKEPDYPVEESHRLKEMREGLQSKLQNRLNLSTPEVKH